MDVASLTRTEAEERAAILAVDHYDIAVDLRGLLEGEVWESTATVRFTCSEPGASTFVDVAAEIVSATLNDVDLDPATAADGRLPIADLRDDNTLVVTTRQTDVTSSAGILRTVDPTDDEVYVWTSLECDDARRLWACFDQPDLKARHRFSVTSPEHWTVLSNMRPETVGEPESGARLWSFPDTPPLSPYVVVVNAGPFHEVREQHGDHDLGLYCRQSLRRLPRPRRRLAVRPHQARPHVLRGPVRPALPGGPLRPGVRPQHGRRDGELGLRHLGRRLPLPHAPDPRAALPDRDHAAPRDGPHVVRRPGHDDAGGTTCGSTRRSRPGPPPGPPRRPPSSPTRGPSSSSAASSTPTASTWGRPPTRSATTSWTSTPPWPTSTRSPTPRASRCSTSSWPTSARTPSSAGSRTTSRGTPGATPGWPT